MTAEILTPFHGSATNPALVEGGKAPERKAEPALIETLQMFMDRAKRGEIQFMGIAYVGPDAISRSCIYELRDATPQLISASLGACAYLNARYGMSAVRGAAEIKSSDNMHAEEVAGVSDEDAED